MTEELRQTVASQAARIAELEAREHNTAITAGIAGAIDAAGVTFAGPSARQHFAELIRQEASLQRDGNGNPVVVGPGLARIEDHVRARLAAPEYRHFVRGGAPAAAGSSAADPAAGLGESLSAQIVKHHHRAAAQKQQAASVVPPGGDISQPFGLRPQR